MLQKRGKTTLKVHAKKLRSKFPSFLSRSRPFGGGLFNKRRKECQKFKLGPSFEFAWM